MPTQSSHDNGALKLFLCGDVMTGRGIDQALPHSVDPVIYEAYVKDARDYIQLAERENGFIQKPLPYDYIWGDALIVWNKQNPDLKLINLETSVTTYHIPWPHKGIQYRMHPKNIDVLKTAGIDHVSLANNHTLDWKRPGLKETMETLEEANIAFSGVGQNEEEAAKPSILSTAQGRVIVFSYGSPSSGIPEDWAADKNQSGVNFLPNLNEEAVDVIRQKVQAVKRSGDVVVFSVHWGSNWGYTIPDEQQRFARQLIDDAGVDLVYGHSSHHPRGIEVYRDKLIIYGAGDFINDYEGIGGKEQYRGELTLMYFPEIDPTTGQLTNMTIFPMEVKKFRLHRADKIDAGWMQGTLDKESAKLGTRVQLQPDNTLTLSW